MHQIEVAFINNEQQKGGKIVIETTRKNLEAELQILDEDIKAVIL